MTGRYCILMILVLSFGLSCTKIEGSITSTGEALGNWTLIPDKCMTGDRSRKVGATLYTDKNPNLFVELFKDPYNRVLIAVAIPSRCDKKTGACKAVILNQGQCSEYSADVKLTNVMTPDDFRGADGHVSLNCNVHVGVKKSRITAHVKFLNCD
jgi:hypothetical protein